MLTPTRTSDSRADVELGKQAATNDKRAFNLSLSQAVMAEFTFVCKSRGRTVSAEIRRLIEKELAAAGRKEERRQRKTMPVRTDPE
jgi:hypothetical protein